MNLNEPRLPSSTPSRRSRSGFVMAISIIWVVASVIGFAMQAFAQTPTGLRGAVSPPAPIAKKMRASRAAPKAKAVIAPTPQSWLGTSVWRTGPCETAQNFQTFNFATASKVEVGNGKPGQGESLEILRVSTDPTGLIQIETRVCAPVGCNQTIERYKKLGADQMQEWHFEGRLPNVTPYVIVANGAAVDGSGPGRVFNRCAG